jgi:hypothetical protein
MTTSILVTWGSNTCPAGRGAELVAGSGGCVGRGEVGSYPAGGAGGTDWLRMRPMGWTPWLRGEGGDSAEVLVDEYRRSWGGGPSAI